MFQKLTFLVLLAVYVMTASAADYLFPSQSPPGNLKADNLTQYVCFIFDDNAYSGLDGTRYEATENAPWADQKIVGEGGNLSEADYGVSWAIRKLGAGFHMTFNVITGQMAEMTGEWSEQGGTQFGWHEYQFETVDWATINDPTPKTVLAPVVWGREMKTVDTGTRNPMKEAYEEIISSGNEIGNHTIDHMESNSGLPNEADAFGLWDSEGFDTDLNEGEQFPAWEKIGWLIDAGRTISKKAWMGAISLGETELTEHLSVSVSAGNLFGFRAPRLEANSSLLHALSELGYLYDCGMEEGWENDIDGKNLYWPFTLDNGSPNVWTQRENGETVHYDSYPAGFWQIPVNTMIVPEGMRDAVYANAKEINDAAPDAGDMETLAEWKAHGRITGFDFNMLVLWGMTHQNWLETMKYNLDMRIASNKAPLHYGCHTDYYSPMYDNATLCSEYNKSSYGLIVSKGWNTWETRQTSLLAFVAYAKTKNVEFVSGKELIDKIKTLQQQEDFGNEVPYSKAEWKWFRNTALTSTTSQETFSGNISGAVINVDKISGTEVPFCGYGSYEHTGYFAELDHIAVSYKTDQTLLLRLTVNGDKPWEVLLNNIGPDVNSGKIPLNAFHYSQYDPGTQTEINTAQINGVEIVVLTPGVTAETANVTVKDVKLYGAVTSSIHNIAKAHNGIAISSITKNALNLKIGTAGKYTVNVLSANGRVIKSFKDMNLSEKTHTLKLNNLSSGIYMIKVNGMKLQRTMKAMVL